MWAHSPCSHLLFQLYKDINQLSTNQSFNHQLSHTSTHRAEEKHVCWHWKDQTDQEGPPGPVQREGWNTALSKISDAPQTQVKQKLLAVHSYSTRWAQQALFLASVCFSACLLPNPVPWCHSGSSRSEEPNSLCHQPFFFRVILKNKTKFVHLVSYGAWWHLHPSH